MEWQLIETAPKDGRNILGGEPLFTSKAGYKLGGRIYICRGCENDWNGEQWIRESGFCQPTHWMPLPKPPEAI